MMKKLIVRPHGKGWQAFSLEKPQTWEAGETADEALGKLTVTLKKDLNIEVTFLEPGQPLPEAGPHPYESRGYSFEMCYEPPVNDCIIEVGISANCYNKDLEYIAFLLEKLKNAIPFPFEIIKRPKIEILAGDRRKGYLSVEMAIEPTESHLKSNPEAVVAMLKKSKFCKGFEMTK